MNQPRVEVWWIRHGESVRNAGQRTRDTYSAPITPLGREQARLAAARLTRRPDLLLHSSFLRARQTAAAISDRFPMSRVESWDIHEFHCLCDERTRDTTRMERDPMVAEYWDRGDPDHVSGVGAESFRGFIARVDRTIERLRSVGPSWVVACSHQQFIQGVVFRLSRHAPGEGVGVDRERMRAFRRVVETTWVPNGGLVRTILSPAPGRSPGWEDVVMGTDSLDVPWPAAPDFSPESAPEFTPESGGPESGPDHAPRGITPG
ncbi:MAG: histidine phosphatase family protein [Phycisphaeraceae bacterium]|nr:histidine phosphatase family protein [Phycisphaerae bacterium]MBX3392548.1 histidine phosphatase family protein [Phycisphaeraceae bacterium]HRJ49258.1 histidine phosphatase family protein [Phycisphaerales bacterium]